MEERVASRTALATARMRAIHTRRDPLPILHDPWGDQLVPASLLVAAIDSSPQGAAGARGDVAEDMLATITDDYLRASPAYTNVIARSRYTEDALAAAIARGVRQYVLVGAGFDSYALRRPPQARAVEVFELDHPATQTLKRQRMADCGIEPGEGVHFVAADLASERVGDALSRTTFDAARPAFFSWLGVTMYLTREANLATLGSIARCSAAGSELVFSYTDQHMFEAAGAPDAALYEELKQSVSSLGEPFVSGFHPAELPRELRTLGLELEEDMSDIQLLQRYDPAGKNGLKAAGRSHIARVRVRGGQH
ncbi:MAG: class I SAM-dependent methyltransferase [Halioglobus sp.]